MVEFPHNAFEDRRELAEKMANAPVDFVSDNAAPLLRILWELQASLALELQVIQGIRRLDVRQYGVVGAYCDQLSDYIERRDFNLERTSCGRISRIYYEQIRPLAYAPGGELRAPELQEILQHFASADAEFNDQIEPFMDTARDAITKMRDAATPEDALRAQEEFVQDYRDTVVSLKGLLKQMSELGNQLLDRL